MKWLNENGIIPDIKDMPRGFREITRETFFKIANIQSHNESSVINQTSIREQATQKDSGITKDYFPQYFSDKEIGYAIKIKKTRMYKTPKCLKADFNLLPPQSFAYTIDANKHNFCQLQHSTNKKATAFTIASISALHLRNINILLNQLLKIIIHAPT